VGDGGYWHRTVKDWMLYIKDLLEDEYEIKIAVIEDTSGDEIPEVYVEEVFVFKGVPGEEGYLIELLKKTLDKITGNNVNEEKSAKTN